MYTVSLLATQPAQLLRWGPAAIRGADCVEVRLDHALEQDGAAWRAAVLALGKPFIVSLHGPGGLGTVAGDRARHMRLLRAAADWGAAFVDVDWSLARALGDLPNGCRRIVSMHRTGAWDGGWAGAYAQLEKHSSERDRIKFVVAADNAVQGLTMMAWARDLPERPAGRLVFCMGESVAFTRILARAQGDPWMYVAPPAGALNPFRPAARGQLALDRMLACDLPMPGPEKPRYQAVLGHPIEHSLSPEVQGAAWNAAGERVFYMAIDPGGPDDWASFLVAATDFGFEGFAVTAPFKAPALRSASESTAEARAVGAANTLAWRGEHFAAHNTDVVGVIQALESSWPAHASARGWEPRLQGRRALIVGSGGAARAARAACSQLGMEVDVCTRRAAAGEEWVSEFGGRAWRPWQVAAGAYDIWIQTSPVGWGARGMVLPPSALDASTLVMEAVYQPAWTPLLLAAHMQGASTVGGRAWFLGQAAAQFEWLSGRPADPRAMAQALDRRLAQTTDLDGDRGRKPLALIGMRASGKSTLGKALARALDLEFVDADSALLESYRESHPGGSWTSAGELLKGLGLSEFRRLELNVLERLLDGASGVVIATGGGVVETETGRKLLRERATCIWLDLPPAALQERLGADAGDRPALTPAGTVQEVPEIYARRLAWYGELAHFGWRGDGARADGIPAEWLAAIRALWGA